MAQVSARGVSPRIPLRFRGATPSSVDTCSQLIDKNCARNINIEIIGTFRTDRMYRDAPYTSPCIF